MESSVVALGLPLALAVIMFGLGLDLTPADFRRVARAPRAVIVALGCQLLLLPAICFGLILLFRLPPALAAGMMLLAASPGGTAANLYSHLFRGDVALNVSLTAINSAVAAFSLPLVVHFAVIWFRPGDLDLGLQFGKMAEVFLIVLTPIALGMAVRHMKPRFATAADRPVRIASILLLTLMVLGVAAVNHAVLADRFVSLGGVTVVFCALGLAIGYGLPRLIGIGTPQAVATAFEVGVHNAALAMVVAQSVLYRPEMALPAAVYGAVMFPLAALFGIWITRRRAT
jgi:bile acid:Na+ symporter, BASS family